MIRLLLSIVVSFVGIGVSAGNVRRIQALEESAWLHSEWISAPDAKVVTGLVKDANICSAEGASWFVYNHTNEQKVVSVKWMATSLGIHDIYVNGKLVGKEVLKPGFTHAQKTKLSFTYDVTDLVAKEYGAVNQFSAQVTPGWWADKVITPTGHDGMVGRKCAFRGVLEVTYSDGVVRYYGTSEQTWKAGVAGPVCHAGIFEGEVYDARIAPGYAAADQLGQPEKNIEFNGEIIPSSGAEVYRREDLTLSPVKAYVWSGVEGAKDDAYGKVVIVRNFKPGSVMKVSPGQTLVVDFGQNAAAVPSFVFKASEGTVLTCLPSEILNDGNGAHNRGMDGPEGSCHRLNLRTPQKHMRLQYTFAGSKEYEQYSPRCTFFGYRYVSITATAPVEFKSIVSVPITSVTPEMEIGRITTGNELVNKLISNTVWGMYSNYLSVPTDCPQRDERLGWTADTQVFAETGSFFAYTEQFLRKWLRDLRDTQHEKGGYHSVAPRALGGRSLMRFGWADSGIIVPWIIWKQYGNIDVIKESWTSMERFMDHLNETKYDHQTLKSENGNYQFADWLSYEPMESFSRSSHYRDENGKSHPLPEAITYWTFLSQSYWLMDAKMMKDMSIAIGEDPGKYDAQISEARSLLKEFFNEDGTFKLDILNTMQTPALFALKNELVTGKARENMIMRLRDNFRQHGNCLQTGFLGTSILMSTLTENGMSDIAYEVLFQRKNPSWLYSVDNGATTIWERWNSYMKEHGMGPKGMNSFNHYAYGCVCEWLWETAAGISCDASGAGFRQIIMRPMPDKRLGSVDAEYNSPYGQIRSSWKYKGHRWVWNFTVPDGAKASVFLPGESTPEEYPSGSYKVEMRITQ